MKLQSKRYFSKVAARLGYTIHRNTPPPDLEPEFLELFQKCTLNSMTSIERMYGLYSAVRYLLNNRIQGDFVECGVWLGGSSMMMALAALKLNATPRIWMYDTYAGMTVPSTHDADFGGNLASPKWHESRTESGSSWCLAPLERVRRNMAETQYPESMIEFVVGPVEETLVTKAPERIALLRLDTDWYESTKAELECLYPRLVAGGVLIVDDYGHWKGARKAVDEYFASLGSEAPLLTRLDYTGRMAVRYK